MLIVVYLLATKMRGVLSLKYDSDMSWSQALGWVLILKIWIFKPSPPTKATQSLSHIVVPYQEIAQRLSHFEVPPESKLRRSLRRCITQVFALAS